MKNRPTARFAPSLLALSVAAAFTTAFAPFAHAGGEQQLQKVVVNGTATGLIGEADSANVGTISQKQLEARTAYRPGELLEATPGLVVSQHSGEGKANQFYLRGFNLDHGTDLRTTVDGMLINQRSHSHGQGWTDLNFLIPELATSLQYKKGPYYASEGDFSSAGAVEINYATALPAGIANVSVGQNGYRRLLLADSPTLGDGKLLYALESMHNDGPFTHPDDYSQLNGVLRYSQGDRANGWNVTGMAYQAKWNATDQIPQRAVEAGQLGRFDPIDPTDGGASHRYSLSGAWRSSTATSTPEANATPRTGTSSPIRTSPISSTTRSMQTNSNQPDRAMTGLTSPPWVPTCRSRWKTRSACSSRTTTSSTPAQHQGPPSAVHHARGPHCRAQRRPWFDNTVRWTPHFRTVAGLRADNYQFNVSSAWPPTPASATPASSAPSST
ncbi:TonB-dependent receptor plug domain-containing protein [Roseateles sp. GG27B]